MFVQELGQLDGRLPAEGHHHADGLFHVDDVHHVFGAKRLEVQPVGGVVVGGHGFGVVVDDDHVVAHFPQRPYAVNGAVIELDALADADGAAAQHDDHRLAAAFQRTGFAVPRRTGIEIRRFGGELRRAGIHHFIAEGPGGQIARSKQPPDGAVRVAHALEARVIALQEARFLDASFQLRHALQLIQEPPVDLGDCKNLVRGDSLFQRLEHGKQASVVLGGQAGENVRVGYGRGVQGVQADFGPAHRLHQRFGEGLADGHHFAGGLHLGA